MSEIHPAPGQQIFELHEELAKLDLIDRRDFTLRIGYDLKPFLEITEDGYAKWVQAHGGETPATSESEEPVSDAGDDTAENKDDTSARAGARSRRTTKGGSQ